MTINIFKCDRIGIFFAILIIGCGSAGVKALIPSFGADQFPSENENEREYFFSFYYMAINIGSFAANVATPTIRAKNCYRNNCFPLAFGVSSGVILIGIVVFLSFTKFYIKKRPAGDLVTRSIKCISVSLYDYALLLMISYIGINNNLLIYF